jgi:hypothetical protein
MSVEYQATLDNTFTKSQNQHLYQGIEAHEQGMCFHIQTNRNDSKFFPYKVNDPAGSVLTEISYLNRGRAHK